MLFIISHSSFLERYYHIFELCVAFFLNTSSVCYVIMKQYSSAVCLPTLTYEEKPQYADANFFLKKALMFDKKISKIARKHSVVSYLLQSISVWANQFSKWETLL